MINWTKKCTRPFLFLSISMILEAIPFGVPLYYTVYEGSDLCTIYETYSYFSCYPFLHYNVFPLLTALLTMITLITISLSCLCRINNKCDLMSKNGYRISLITLALLATLFSIIACIIARTLISCIIALFLLLSLFFLYKEASSNNFLHKES